MEDAPDVGGSEKREAMEDCCEGGGGGGAAPAEGGGEHEVGEDENTDAKQEAEVELREMGMARLFPLPEEDAEAEDECGGGGGGGGDMPDAVAEGREVIFLPLVRWFANRWSSASSSCLTSTGASRSISPPASRPSTGVRIVSVFVDVIVVVSWLRLGSPRRLFVACGWPDLQWLWEEEEEEVWLPRSAVLLCWLLDFLPIMLSNTIFHARF